jgi:hypothetical protein
MRCAEVHRSNHRWAREHPGRRDPASFEREIVQKLGTYPLKAGSLSVERDR